MSTGILYFFTFFKKNFAFFIKMLYNSKKTQRFCRVCGGTEIKMPSFQINADYISVSADFIENKMPQANGAYVKVYMHMLYLAVKNIDEENSAIAAKLNLLESDVVNAVNYWCDCGAMSNENGVITIITSQAPVRTIAAIPEREPSPAPLAKPERSAAKEMLANKELADLCMLAQEILGKTLNTSETETLFWFYDSLGLSPEVITMLLEYCVSKGKRNMNYIEKVAVSWHDNGITTMSAAETYISDEQGKKNYTYELKKLFGIDGRNLSKSEELYLKVWHDDFNMSVEMIALAYEYCIMSTGKLSFPYMNKIIENWSKKNISTIEAAEEDHENFKTQSSPEKDSKVFSDKGFDYDEIEKLMREKM